VIKSVVVGSASVAPEIVPIGTRILVCVGLHGRIESIVSGSFVSIGVGIKSNGPKIVGIRLKNGGIINCILVRDGNIVVVNFKIIIAVRFLNNIIVRFGRIKISSGKCSYSSADSTSSSKKSSTDAFGRHSKSGTPPLISGWPSFSAMASTALVMGISVH